jgi:hypothetical protein
MIVNIIGDVMTRFFKSIKNLIGWFPVIWNDKDWDSAYIYTILHKKISNMEDFFRTDAIISEADRVADEINTVVLALQRLVKDEYEEIAFEDHDKKWGKIGMIEAPWKMHKFNFTRKNVTTEEDKKIEKQEMLACFDRVEAYRQCDIDLVCDTMKEKIQEWWD